MSKCGDTNVETADHHMEEKFMRLYELEARNTRATSHATFLSRSRDIIENNQNIKSPQVAVKSVN
jgi:hemerythrin